ncbi:protein-tyrosine phosphatase family protein [Catellatospora tritici]|uniref:protein-tyrosine phosphatase family protein n=1 Tax=Catellatospora tritici TaxID=2851566 RepID=UPI001C2CEDB2|nr:tyrosine protein phosphatase [Catellatospora tritici]MBV1848726.1 tyrosine protein phosphatase [Catellatospora tritici]
MPHSEPYVVHHTPGRVAMMPRPGRNVQLDADLAQLRAAHGVDVVVCALSEDELELLGLLGEAHAVRRAGMRFEHFPIGDHDVPEFAPYLALTARLAADVTAGAYVVAHCWAGIGRSGLLAGGVLIHLGLSAQQAMARLTEARGLPSPETRSQRDILVRLAETVAPSI